MAAEFLVTVRNKIATYTGAEVYVCGNSDYTVKFDFDDEWKAFETKTARFIKKDGTPFDKVFTGDVCPVPKISNTYGIYVGVFAGDLHTTTKAYIPAKQSVLCGGGLPADPQPDVFAQIMAKLNELEHSGVTEEQLAQAIADYLAENPIEGVSAEEVEKAVEAALAEAKASGEFDGAPGEPGEPGKDGEPGKSAYQYAQDGGYTGTEAEFAAKLAKEIPEAYTLPTASADVKGGVKVGNGLQMDGDVLGVVPEKQFELIETVTVEEDGVKGYTFKNNLKSFLLIVDVPAGQANSTGGMEVYKNEKFVGYVYLGTAVKTNAVRHILRSEEGYTDKSYVVFGTTDTHTSSGKLGTKTLNASNYFSNMSEPYTRIVFYTTTAMPVGTAFELRGVYADA